MIPDLALMISAYVGFRMVEVFLLADTRYVNRASKVAACVLAAVALAVIGFSLLSIMTSSSQIPTP